MYWLTFFQIKNDAACEPPRSAEIMNEGCSISKPKVSCSNITTSGSASRISLSLKKRKHTTDTTNTVPQKVDDEVKKVCKDSNISGSKYDIMSVPVSNSTSISPEDHSAKSLSRMSLPFSPTFSPRKNTCSSFSPLELGKRLAANEEQAQMPGLNTSIPLFSTPSPNVISSPHTERKKVAKRALFSITPMESSSECADASNSHDCFFGNDVSLSEFLNISNVMDSIETPEINRYLVLEVATQASAEVQDNGRLARLLSTRKCISFSFFLQAQT